MGGDSRIQVGGGAIGQISNLSGIDANSTKAGDFTEQRNVGGEQVYLTQAGAAAYDKAVANGENVKAEADPGFLKRFFAGDPLAGKEEHSGKTK